MKNEYKMNCVDENNGIIGNNGQEESQVHVCKNWKWKIKEFLSYPPYYTKITRQRPNPCGSLSPKTFNRKTPDILTTDGFKICIDVSGAVGQDDIDYILEVITKGLKRSTRKRAELIYWSDTVDCAKSFSGLRDKENMARFQHKKGCTRDISPLLDYLMKKGEVNGFNPPSHPNLMEFILIVTDGKLEVPEEFQEMYKIRNKVRWLIVGDGAEEFAAMVNSKKVLQYSR